MKQIIDWDFADSVLPLRAADSNKNNYGRVLCICGSAMYSGAAYFAAMGAVRMGSGVVTLASPRAAWQALAAKLHEPVICPMPEDDEGRLHQDALPQLLSLAGKADAVLIGCGLGRSDNVTKIVGTLLRETLCQIVLDADGINALDGHMDIVRQAARPVVLTPHAGEFARISGIRHPDEASLAHFAVDNRCILLYKGHRTRVATPEGQLFENTSGNPGMAKGGSGDVLAGMIVSLCGQGLCAADAACTGAFLHGKAGDLAANELSEYGMTPSDMLHYLPRLLKRYNTREW
ncbi:NAD(P)H-hydrate dehydratase [Butyricicoccus faecihominis]|uniref:NAD(P)H-hydrate dehydratase n=1 Tax=Butyricicoccus faecihominis TaxID=1712515 RepID=UPI0024784DFB|nr:NAD(P)H-hydrate dehydratase [Butyricicoccus faecihominis]MCQ5128187.1 NAD(P)H-hydrate dehydratase [Butyricicoccus faecihominis]